MGQVCSPEVGCDVWVMGFGVFAGFVFRGAIVSMGCYEFATPGTYSFDSCPPELSPFGQQRGRRCGICTRGIVVDAGIG